MRLVEPLDLHAAIFVEGREKIEMGYMMAVKRGLERPVVLALNLHDPVARQMAETSGLHENIGLFIQEAVRRGVRPILVWHLPAAFVQKLLSEVAPDIADELMDDPPESHFSTVIVSDGYASIHPVPVMK